MIAGTLALPILAHELSRRPDGVQSGPGGPSAPPIAVSGQARARRWAGILVTALAVPVSVGVAVATGGTSASIVAGFAITFLIGAAGFALAGLRPGRASITAAAFVVCALVLLGIELVLYVALGNTSVDDSTDGAATVRAVILFAAIPIVTTTALLLWARQRRSRNRAMAAGHPG